MKRVCTPTLACTPARVGRRPGVVARGIRRDQVRGSAIDGTEREAGGGPWRSGARLIVLGRPGHLQAPVNLNLINITSVRGTPNKELL